MRRREIKVTVRAPTLSVGKSIMQTIQFQTMFTRVVDLSMGTWPSYICYCR